METGETRSASNVVVATSDVREARRRGMRAPTTRERESRASGLRRRRDNELCKRRPTAPGGYAEVGTRQTGNSSNAVVATSDTSEGRRRGRRLPATRERERRASDFGRRRDDERRKRRPTAPEAHTEVGSRETQSASNVVGQQAKQGKVVGARGARRRHVRARDARVILLEMKRFGGVVVYYKIALASCDAG